MRNYLYVVKKADPLVGSLPFYLSISIFLFLNFHRLTAVLRLLDHFAAFGRFATEAADIAD